VLLNPSRVFPGIVAAALLHASAPASHAEQPAIRSRYTTLVPEQCRLLRTHAETSATDHRCPGVAGYALEMADDDARMSITVVAPNGTRHPLNYWSVVTHNFSSLGPRAEWRLNGAGRGTPIALIVRVNANEHPERPSRVTSYLAVATISPRRVCVTHRIPPSATANEQARRAADRSASAPCLRER
jgi:hypothetical protein